MSAAHSFDPRSGPAPLPQRGSSAGASQTRRRDGTLLRIIAVLKFLKAASLIALSVGVFRTMHQDIGLRLEHWIRAMHLDPGNRHIEMFLERVSNLSPAQVKRLGLVGLLYAGLFLVEGTGLWLQRRWGEWATVVITGLLIPVEVYEIFRHPSAAKILVLIVNMAVVGYLVYRIRTTEATV
ncbi:MAG TPA: DUF2127 domain-containing protein [Candidatus Sulfotelmatobacter sp.]|nr:DUF2127 domain-containing protein [Candidatus Sulfotelmatobacter sp.]